jgi:integrase
LKLLRILINYAIAHDQLTHDPSRGIKRPKSGEIRAWTDAEIAQFESRWPIGTKQRLAFALMLYTGQRRSDVARMAWNDIVGGSIKVVQQKTGAKLTIPLALPLREVLAASARKHASILVTEYGRAFQVDGFGGWMRDAITAAGLPLDCQPHGLRKTAGKRLAEAGATTKQIMAMLGHRSISEAERYTANAEQAALAMAAVAVLERKQIKRPNPFGGDESSG